MTSDCRKCIFLKVRLSEPYFDKYSYEYIHPAIRYDCTSPRFGMRTIKVVQRDCKGFTSPEQEKLDIILENLKRFVPI